MDRNKVIISGIIVVIVILVIGIVVTMPIHEKDNTQLTIKAESPIHKGDKIQIKLTDGNNTPIANQTINVTITDKDNASSYYSVVTNDKGVGKLKLDKSEGKYSINCTYGGNENYTGNTTVKKIKIEKKVAESETTQYSSSESSDDGYTYSPQSGKYIKNSGQSEKDSRGNTVYSYKGDDGVIYERYYDSNGKEIDPNDYYR